MSSMDTNALIAYHREHSDLPEPVLEKAIPAAIAALYGARDAGGTMHDAGAAAAVVVLQATSTPNELAFSAPPDVWRKVADAWYGGGDGRPFRPDLHREAERLMGDIDDATRKASTA